MIIVSYEGLAGSLGRWVRRGLLNRFDGVKKIEHVWTDRAFEYPNDEIIVIGHSFGVKGAVETARINRNVKMLLLLDPRMPPWGTGGVVAPEGVSTVCFYQTGFMRGHPVSGAKNIQVKAMHTYVPAFAVETLREALR